MRRALAVLFFAVASAAAGDIVLLLEDTPGMQPALRQMEIPTLNPGDRMAVMTFSRKARLRQDFTDDRRKLARVAHGQDYVRARWPGAERQPGASVYAALAEAARLLPSGGTIVLLFGSNDLSGAAPPASLGARLYAVAVAKSYPVDPELRNVQTPPTMRGPTPAVSTLADPLPLPTLEALKPLVRATRGETFSGRWSLPKLVAQARP